MQQQEINFDKPARKGGLPVAAVACPPFSKQAKTSNAVKPRQGANAPQWAILLAYMKDGKWISPLEAWQQLKIYRLSARIYDLKQRDYNIETRDVVTTQPDGEKITFRRYRLAATLNGEDKENVNQVPTAQN